MREITRDLLHVIDFKLNVCFRIKTLESYKRGKWYVISFKSWSTKPEHSTSTVVLKN